jgi:hypothetical protein
MSGSLSGKKDKSSSTQSSSSKPLTAKELEDYYASVNKLSGGRLNAFAQTGTQAPEYSGVALEGEAADGRPGIETASYNELTPEQLRAVGGAGETRRRAIERLRDQAVSDQAADPRLSVAQRFRARQLTDQQAQGDLDAVNAESEAQIAQLASEQRGRTLAADQSRAEVINTITQSELGRRYEAALTKAGLTAKDLELLANIYFGGKGQVSSSQGEAMSRGWGFAASGGAASAPSTSI